MFPTAVDTAVSQSTAVGPTIGFDTPTKPKKRSF